MFPEVYGRFFGKYYITAVHVHFWRIDKTENTV